MHAQVSAEELEDTQQRLRSINSLAQVVRAQRADVKADYVLGIGGFDLDRLADEVDTGLSRLVLPDFNTHVPTVSCYVGACCALKPHASRKEQVRHQCAASQAKMFTDNLMPCR